MIDSIGVIYEDAISLGFLEGLKERLRCQAQFIPPTPAIGNSSHLKRRTAKQAWRYFQKKGVQLVLHFTDADGKRWQDVKKSESALFPNEAANFVVVGVAVDDVEGWLSLDKNYAAQTLGLTLAEIEDEAHGGDRIKKALRAIRRPDEKLSQTVARFVANVPVDVFRRWLKDPALEDFYQACRAAANRADCDTPNELDLPE